MSVNHCVKEEIIYFNLIQSVSLSMTTTPYSVFILHLYSLLTAESSLILSKLTGVDFS